MPNYSTETNLYAPKPIEDHQISIKRREYKPPMESIVEQSSEFDGTATYKNKLY
jgi:hypothetical protein